jgi:hypothetical protein
MSLWLREAPVGIEPTNGGFADLCLTTWLRRQRTEPSEIQQRQEVSAAVAVHVRNSIAGSSPPCMPA